MFKKGDRVERINSDFGITYVGNIYTVKECGKDNGHYDYYVLLEEDKQPNRRYNADSFRLAKEDKCQFAIPKINENKCCVKVYYSMNDQKLEEIAKIENVSLEQLLNNSENRGGCRRIIIKK